MCAEDVIYQWRLQAERTTRHTSMALILFVWTMEMGEGKFTMSLHAFGGSIPPTVHAQLEQFSFDYSRHCRQSDCRLVAQIYIGIKILQRLINLAKLGLFCTRNSRVRSF